MSKILSSIACNLDANILLAAIPLFETEKVQAIEWAFDTLFAHNNIPSWFEELIQTFSQENRLIGHGVFFSLFSGKWTPEQADWLKNLKKLSQKYTFDHVTEHFGYMTGKNFHHGAPLSIPFNKTTLSIGQDRLKRIFEVCKCPVGLENLAFSYAFDEVKKHGDFLAQLVEPINGFIILDLHNLYCQIHNFDIAFEDIIRLYPLEKVREIHISGGSWEDSVFRSDKKVRRDTHDDAVPMQVFDLLEKTIPLCPNLKYVVLEQLGDGLKTEAQRLLFQQDFFKLDAIIEKHNENAFNSSQNAFFPKPSDVLLPQNVLEDAPLHAQQMQLSNILETAESYQDALQRLQNSNLAHSDWQIETWQPYMLDTAIQIAQKWR